MRYSDLSASKVWYMCEAGICLYSEASVNRLPNDPARCIKHGEILGPAYDLYGLDRKEARKKLLEDKAREERQRWGY
jgi:hypothetical protein